MHNSNTTMEEPLIYNQHAPDIEKACEQKTEKDVRPKRDTFKRDVFIIIVFALCCALAVQSHVLGLRDLLEEHFEKMKLVNSEIKGIKNDIFDVLLVDVGNSSYNKYLSDKVEQQVTKVIEQRLLTAINKQVSKVVLPRLDTIERDLLDTDDLILGTFSEVGKMTEDLYTTLEDKIDSVRNELHSSP